MPVSRWERSADNFAINSVIQHATQEQEVHFSFRDLFLSSTLTASPPVAKRPASRTNKVWRLTERTPDLPKSLASNHQRRRMQRYREAHQDTPKKLNQQNWRAKKGVERSITVPAEFSDLRSSYTVQREARVYSLGELKGVKIIEWDGKNALPIKTKSGLVIAVLAGQPGAPSWGDAMESLENAMDLTASRVTFNEDQSDHRRGKYPTVATGLSYGGGATQPGELGLGSRRNARAVLELRDMPELSHLSGFVNQAIDSYAPILATFCRSALTRLEEDKPALHRPFPNSAFGTITFDFGPEVCTIPHKDYKNLSWGWCAVTSFGDYDPKKGGHLILWDLKIAVEFPPHSTILIPSAIVEHSNTAIQTGERRQTITQYNSAGIFRWVAYGFIPKWVANAFEVEPWEWWAKPRHMFSRIFD